MGISRIIVVGGGEISDCDSKIREIDKDRRNGRSKFNSWKKICYVITGLLKLSQVHIRNLNAIVDVVSM